MIKKMYKISVHIFEKLTPLSPITDLTIALVLAFVVIAHLLDKAIYADDKFDKYMVTRDRCMALKVG